MKMKKILCAGLVLLMLLAAASCGAMKAEADMNLSYGTSADMYYDAPMEEGKYVEISKSESLFDGTSGAGGSIQESTGEFEEKLLVTVTLRAQTKEYEAALSSIRGTLAALGGYEESFSSNGRSYGSSSSYCRSAHLTVRIPAEKLDGFLSEVGALVNVVHEQVGRVNATEEYYDLAARVSVLEEERKAYEAMLSKAVDVEEVLLIKDRLYNVISEIESAKTRMKVIDSRASYSTVHLTLDEVVDYSTVTTPKTTFGSRISNAFTRSWRNFADGFQNFVVWFIGAIPTFLVLGAIGAGVAVIVVTSNRRFKKRLAEKNENK